MKKAKLSEDQAAAPTTEAQSPGNQNFGPGNQEAIRMTCEAIGQIIEGWGFKRIMGTLWAFLYLCPEPATSKDICSNLKISPALASITLQDPDSVCVEKLLFVGGNIRNALDTEITVRARYPANLNCPDGPVTLSKVP